MSALVIGYGSIGGRHARLLTELGCRVSVVSSRAVDFPVVFHELDEALATERPDYVVIANATSQHHATLSRLASAGYAGRVLVEKPLFEDVHAMPPNAFADVRVAYNLRFHPVIRRLKALLDGEKVLSVQVYAGQYLPEWRPGTDYRASYSASAEKGGGVLRDLSHELDYLGWMLGGWKRVCALGGHFSPLEISSDDVYALMLTTPACPVVTVQMNYLDRQGRRSILVNTERHTLEADLVEGAITLDKAAETFQVERDTSYREMHRELLAAGGTACTLEEGMSTMRLIAAAEQSAKNMEWVAA